MCFSFFEISGRIDTHRAAALSTSTVKKWKILNTVFPLLFLPAHIKVISPVPMQYFTEARRYSVCPACTSQHTSIYDDSGTTLS